MSQKVLKQIKLSSQLVDYTFERSKRARVLKLSINPEGNLSVTAPWFLGFWQAKLFMKRKERWILESMKKMKKRSKSILFSKISKKDYRELKEKARQIVLEKVREFNQIYNFDYKRISIKNQKTRWGSCSSKRNLNYNLKIALLPGRLIDYIIIHELCHLKEMNHSKRFWKLVGKTVPDYKEMRKKLRTL